MNDLDSELRRLITSLETEPTPVAVLAERGRRRRRRRIVQAAASAAVVAVACVGLVAATVQHPAVVATSANPSATAARQLLHRVALPPTARRVRRLPSDAQGLSGWAPSCRAAGHATAYWLVRGRIDHLFNVITHQHLDGFRKTDEAPPGGSITPKIWTATAQFDAVHSRDQLDIALEGTLPGPLVAVRIDSFVVGAGDTCGSTYTGPYIAATPLGAISANLVIIGTPADKSQIVVGSILANNRHGLFSGPLLPPSHGPFHINLPPGRYTLEAQSPNVDNGRRLCGAHTVAVTKGRTTHATVTCHVLP